MCYRLHVFLTGHSIKALNRTNVVTANTIIFNIPSFVAYQD